MQPSKDTELGIKVTQSCSGNAGNPQTPLFNFNSGNFICVASTRNSPTNTVKSYKRSTSHLKVPKEVCGSIPKSPVSLHTNKFEVLNSDNSMCKSASSIVSNEKSTGPSGAERTDLINKINFSCGLLLQFNNYLTIQSDSSLQLNYVETPHHNPKVITSTNILNNSSSTMAELSSP